MLSFLLRNAGGRRHPRKGFYRTLVALGPIIIPTSKGYTLVEDTSDRNDSSQFFFAIQFVILMMNLFHTMFRSLFAKILKTWDLRV